MVISWKTNLILLLVTCFLKFSAGIKEESFSKDSPESSNDEKRQLVSAVQRVDLQAVRKLIRAGALEEFYHGIYSNSGRRTLNTIYDKLDIVNDLLRFGIVDVADNSLYQPDDRLFNVTLIPDTELVMTLSVNLAVVKSWTNETLIKSSKIPLFMIAALPDVSRETVKLVLDAGTVDIDVQNESNDTALIFAAARGNLDVVKFFLENGANVNNLAFTEYDPEDKVGLHYDFLKIFTKQNVSFPSEILRYSALFAAANQNRPEVVKYLLKNGAHVNFKEKNWPLLFGPVSWDLKEIVEVLLKNGIDVNSKNPMGTTVLHKIASRDNIEMAKLLLKYGADPNATDNFGWTPLHVASFFSPNATKSMIELLLDSDSNVNAETDGGFSPLNLAEAGSNLRFIGYLVGKHEILNFTQVEHVGLAELETDEKHAEVIDFLLSRGADLNHQDDIFGWTTLHWATASGDMRTTVTLVEKYGAAMKSSKLGMTPFGTAKHFGRKSVFEYFNTARNLV